MYLVSKNNLLKGYDMKSLTLDYLKIGFTEQANVANSEDSDSFSVDLSLRKWSEKPTYIVEMQDTEHRNNRRYVCSENQEFRWESKENECQAQADACNRFIKFLQEYLLEHTNGDGERILEPTEQQVNALIKLGPCITDKK